jgi:hypothetical protein
MVSRIIPLVLVWFGACFLLELDLLVVLVGVHLIRAGMVVQLAMVKQERNTAILKVIEKDDAIKRSSEQLQSVY